MILDRWEKALSDELLERIVELLERIESKLDALDRVSDHADAASSTLSRFS